MRVPSEDVVVVKQNRIGYDLSSCRLAGASIYLFAYDCMQ